jgi:hypothetical protein
MQGQFALTFVDLTAYLLPGLVVLIPLAWLIRQYAAYQSPNLMQALALLGTSYILGILIHRLSFIIVYPSWVFTGQPPIEHVLSQIPETNLVTTSISKRLNIANLSRIQSYLYAQSLIAEKFPQSALSADRLHYLALLCRSLIVSIIVAAAAALLLLHRSKRWKWRYWWYSIPLGLAVFLLHRSFSVYEEASVLKTLRAYLIWASFQ